MLYRLEIENFFSIRDQQVLDVTVAPNVSDSAWALCANLRWF